jgi:hypothetical protein
MARIGKLCCVACFFILLSSANASTIIFSFSGNVTQVPFDEAFGDIAFGDAIQGSLSFDSSAVDLVPADPAVGSYSFSSPFGMTLTIGAHNFITSGSLNIGILNSFVDQFTVLATSALGDLTLELFLQDNTGSVFTNDHLPSVVPPLTAFGLKDFHLDAITPDGEVQVDGQIGAPAVQGIPEPRSTVYILAGALVFVLLRRKRTLLFI